MNIPYLAKKIRDIFGDEKELDVKDFKDRTVKLRLGGKDWMELSKDLEELDVITVRGRKIRLGK